MDDPKLNAVNQSGFPLQVALMNQVEKADGWRAVYSEQFWERGDESGYTDFVVESCAEKGNRWLLNIECKKNKDVDWFFLCEETSKTTDIRLATYQLLESGEAGARSLYKIPPGIEWKGATVLPESRISSFFVQRGGGGERPMIERIASTLVASSEAIAVQEHGTLINSYAKSRAIQNVIVTNAPLKICNLNADDVDLSTGKLGSASFDEVPFIRFRKQLGATLLKRMEVKDATDLKDWIRATESTVMVVNATHFLDFLNRSELRGIES